MAIEQTGKGLAVVPISTADLNVFVKFSSCFTFYDWSGDIDFAQQRPHEPPLDL
jgi:hypothetical protein